MITMRNINPKIVAWCFPSVMLAVMVSVRFFDAWLAMGAKRLLNASSLLHRSTSDIPDILFLIVCIGSGLLWINYFTLRRQGINNRLTQFSQLAGCAVPLSYILKDVFKYIFGRTNTRFWLKNRVPDEFHWFQGGDNFNGFPSGHMAVFTAFFAAVWIFYPRYRTISIGLLLVLTVALIGTYHHFLSDVIAGAYLGLIATCLARICIDRKWA